MAPDYFKLYPEFHSDIPVFNPLAQSLLPGTARERAQVTYKRRALIESGHIDSNRLPNDAQLTNDQQRNQDPETDAVDGRGSIILVGEDFQSFNGFDELMF
jgi:hypothetical protein